MNVFLAAARAYLWVNVSGKLNDVALDSGALISGAARSRLALRRRQAQRAPMQRSRAQCAADGLRDGATYFGSTARLGLGVAFSLHRGSPPLWGVATPFLEHTRLGAVAPLYPFAEMLVGRGYTYRPTPRHFSDTPFGVFSRIQHEVSKFGVLGLALEKLPLMGVVAAHDRHQHKLATACMVAATLGRLLLQFPRLAVAAAALVNEAFKATVVTAFVTAIELGLRVGRVALSQTAAATGRPLAGPQACVSAALHFFEHLPDHCLTVFAGERPEAAGLAVDDGSPGVLERIRLRTNALLEAFRPLENRPVDADGNYDPQTLLEALAVAERLAEDLRRYCAQLPDATAVRFGLALVVAYVDQDWGCDAIGFHPPELQAAVARAA